MKEEQAFDEISNTKGLVIEFVLFMYEFGSERQDKPDQTQLLFRMRFYYETLITFVNFF